MATTLRAQRPDSEQHGSTWLPLILSKEDCGDRQKTTEQPDDRIGNFCPESQVLDTYEINGELWHLMQGRCNRWSCDVCGPEKTRDLCRRIEAARPNRFITLTCGRPAGRSPREVWDDTRRQVPELIRRIRNEVGSIEYCRVMEEHKSGYPHFHLVVRSPYIEQQTLARWWCDLTDAFIVDIRRIDPDRRVAKYIAKYLCKTYASTISDRRVTNSKEFFPPKDATAESDYCSTRS